MRRKNQPTFDDWLVVTFVVLGILAAFLLGCGSAYPECTDADEYRCDGDEIQLCTGEHWHPRIDCGVAGMTCEEIDGFHTCVPVDGGADAGDGGE